MKRGSWDFAQALLSLLEKCLRAALWGYNFPIISNLPLSRKSRLQQREKTLRQRDIGAGSGKSASLDEKDMGRGDMDGHGQCLPLPFSVSLKIGDIQQRKHSATNHCPFTEYLLFVSSGLCTSALNRSI